MRFIFFSVFLYLLVACNTKPNNGSDQSASISDDSLSDDSLLTRIQQQTFLYFWEGAEPVSGLARERIHIDGAYPQNDQDVVTIGGSGFGLMALLVGIERQFITRHAGVERLQQVI